MKKIFMMLSVFMLFISACQSSDESIDTEKQRVYSIFKEKVIANNGTLSYNIPFSYTLEVLLLDDGTYAYTVIIDNPQIVMNQVKMMALQAGATAEDKMEPTVGILEDESYSLIPNQVDVAKGYPKGLAINGISETSDFSIYVIVSFYSEMQSEVQVFFAFDVVDGVVLGNEVYDEYE